MELNSEHLCQEDTSLLRTPKFSPKLVISIHFDLYDQDTTQLRITFVSPKGALIRDVPLYMFFTEIPLKSNDARRNSAHYETDQKCRLSITHTKPNL
jgi:hypothetical protein